MYLAIILWALFTNAHITVKSPAARAGTTSNPTSVVCQGIASGASTATVAAGANLPLSLNQGADHGGGGCVFSLACANELSDPSNPKFKTIFVTDKTCPMTKEYSIKIPKEANGNCVLSWGWVPILSGGPEMYQNCMDITVTGGTGGAIPGPDLVYFNSLNPGKILQGDNGGRRTLFDEFFQTERVIGVEESIQLAKEKDFGINLSSSAQLPGQFPPNIPFPGTTEDETVSSKCTCTCPNGNMILGSSIVPNPILRSSSVRHAFYGAFKVVIYLQLL
jgi:hypothetical protein